MVVLFSIAAVDEMRNEMFVIAQGLTCLRLIVELGLLIFLARKAVAFNRREHLRWISIMILGCLVLIPTTAYYLPRPYPNINTVHTIVNIVGWIGSFIRFVGFVVLIMTLYRLMSRPSETAVGDAEDAGAWPPPPMR